MPSAFHFGTRNFSRHQKSRTSLCSDFSDMLEYVQKCNLFLINLNTLRSLLTDCGTYPQLPTQPKKIVRVQTNTVVFYGHPELSGEEKSKFEFEEKKFSIVLKMEIC